MSEVLPFILTPLLVYAYFWLNPAALATFLEGAARYVAEVYLGYKRWRIEYQTRKAFKRYQRQAKRLARQNGYPDEVVRAYFNTYSEQDWQTLREQQKELHEQKYKDWEDELQSLILW